jgi:peptidoglycan/LPS O-acetylase OafA/YrhL
MHPRADAKARWRASAILLEGEMQLRQLTFLRFIAALGVVVFHYGTHTPSLAWAQPYWRFANSAVSFFFFLSGFILTHVYATRRETRRLDFYVSRAARILPLYFLALLAATTFHLEQGTLRWDSLALNALVIQAWVPGHSQTINSAGWSLSVEAFFYLTFPLLLTTIVRIESSARLLMLSLCSWALNLLVHVILVDAATADPALTPLDDFSVYHPLTHLATFIGGVCGARLFSLERRVCDRWAPILIVTALSGVVALPLLPDTVLRYHHNGLFTPLFLPLVIGLAAAQGRAIARVLSWRPFEFLGEISYGLYILQIPVGWLFFALLGSSGLSVTDDQKFWLLSAVLIASASVCQVAVEAPLRSFINRQYRRSIQNELGAPSAARVVLAAPQTAPLHPPALPATVRRSS